MGALEENTQVFIVRFWREPREFENARPEWRGVVEHLKSGERRFVQSPNDVALFVAAYVMESGATPRISAKVRRWLKERWK